MASLWKIFPSDLAFSNASNALSMSATSSGLPSPISASRCGGSNLNTSHSRSSRSIDGLTCLPLSNIPYQQRLTPSASAISSWLTALPTRFRSRTKSPRDEASQGISFRSCRSTWPKRLSRSPLRAKLFCKYTLRDFILQLSSTNELDARATDTLTPTVAPTVGLTYTCARPPSANRSMPVE